MSTRSPLTLACGTYDINQGLIDGSVVAKGIDLTVLTYASPERHWRMARYREFDACEYSMASFLVLHGRGERDLVAIPAFPHRRFRHGFIFVNTAAGIARPEDLNGRRIGVRTWQTTAGLWARGILQDDHGVDLASIRWFSQDEEDIPLDLPRRLSLERVPEGRTVTGMLLDGELDALIYPEASTSLRDDRVRRLFTDPKAAEIEYFGRTGLFPIMHTVVIKRTILEARPWVATELLDAFRRSKDAAFRRMEDPRAVSLAWLQEAVDEQRSIMGPDPWRYELGANLPALETMARYAFEQGLVPAPVDVTDLFASTTLADVPAYV